MNTARALPTQSFNRSKKAVSTGKVPAVQPQILAGFHWYLRRYLRKHFHAVRISRQGSAPDTGDSPVIVYLNHPGWWDPMIGLFLARHYFPVNSVYAPIDADQLQRYRILGRLGFFGVRTNTYKDLKMFQQTAASILHRPKAMLWLTPHGQFVDARRRDIAFQPGLAHLVAAHPQARVLPLALEYAFWNDRLPEALARFGPVLSCAELKQSFFTHADLTAHLQDKLQEQQTLLAEESQERNPSLFQTCSKGRLGVGGVYDLWRRAAAWLRLGRPRLEHGGTDA